MSFLEFSSAVFSKEDNIPYIHVLPANETLIAALPSEADRTYLALRITSIAWIIFLS
jgi:hypothetical protein